MPYLLLFPAAWTLRRKDPDAAAALPRARRDRASSPCSASLTTVIIFATFVLFLWPEIPNAPAAWSFTGPLLAIVGVTLVVGEIIVARQMRRMRPTAGSTGRGPRDAHDSTTTPAADGFRMPGEFEPHDGCWMIWPERPDNWRLGGEARAGGVRGRRGGDPPERPGDDGGLRAPVRARARRCCRRACASSR